MTMTVIGTETGNVETGRKRGEGAIVSVIETEIMIDMLTGEEIVVIGEAAIESVIGTEEVVNGREIDTMTENAKEIVGIVTETVLSVLILERGTERGKL